MKNKSKIKVVRKLNLIAVIISAISLVCLILNNVTATKYYETKKIVVGENDTIWNIAKDICDENNSLNMYDVMKDIKKLNDMSSSLIYPNEVLEIYVY